LNQLTDFHETMCEHHDARGYPTYVRFKTPSMNNTNMMAT